MNAAGRNPRVFIGASTEGDAYARGVFAELEAQGAQPTVWHHAQFNPGRSTWEHLEGMTGEFDFAVFVLSEDDEVTSRGTTVAAPRDNVIAELGLFTGALGRDRVFFLLPRSNTVKLPSDLLGITYLHFTVRDDDNYRAAVSTACTTIAERMRALGRLHGGARRSRDAEGGRVARYNITSAASRREFYKATIAVVRAANVEMYKAGRGVSKPSDRRDDTVAEYVEAEREALARGVQFRRVQLARKVSGEWPDLVADMVDRYPSQYRVYEDFSDRSFINVSVVDPDSDSPIVEFLFDTPQANLDGDRFMASTALIVYDNRPLAQALRTLFVERIRMLKPMPAHRIRALAFDHLYFAYGANLDSDTMRARAPSAEPVSVGYLEDWALRFGVPGPHLEGVGAAIVAAPGQRVWGVIYALTDADRYRLDIAEEAAYRPQRLLVHAANDDSDYEAIVYVPHPGALDDKPVPVDRDYLDRMIAAARRWGMSDLEHELVAHVGDG